MTGWFSLKDQGSAGTCSPTAAGLENVLGAASAARAVAVAAALQGRQLPIFLSTFFAFQNNSGDDDDAISTALIIPCFGG